MFALDGMVKQISLKATIKIKCEFNRKINSQNEIWICHGVYMRKVFALSISQESMILILLLSESRHLCSKSHFITKSCQILYKLVSSYICCCLAFLDIWCRKAVLVAIISLGTEESEVFIDKWTVVSFPEMVWLQLIIIS